MNELANLSPVQQLRAPRMPRRLTQLMVGLILYGLSLAMMVEAHLGLDPWDVLHDGIAGRLPLSFGTVVILAGVLVLLLWWPLRQMPGLGTIANVVVVGVASDVSLFLIEQPATLAGRSSMLVAGVVLNAVAGALYIGAQLGPGPRDGLMTGIVRRTGWSVRVVRTSIELAVLAIGFLLGGIVGVGTVLYALAIGPLLQLFLPPLIVPLTPVSRGDSYRAWLSEYRPTCRGAVVRSW